MNSKRLQYRKIENIEIPPIEITEPSVNASGNGNTNNTLTVPSSSFFSLQNDSDNTIEITINDLTLFVAPYSSLNEKFTEFTSVGIVASGEYNWYSK